MILPTCDFLDLIAYQTQVLGVCLHDYKRPKYQPPDTAESHKVTEQFLNRREGRMGTLQKSGISDEANWGDVSLVLLLDPCHNLSNKVCVEGRGEKTKG